MPPNDAFALKNSGLNAFLFAEVGTEQSGSRLTVLSVLARLGNDPWAQAAAWDKMRNAAKIEALTRAISQMPLCPCDLADARATAARLITLLPSVTGGEPRITRRAGTKFDVPEWVPRAAFGILLGVAIIAGTIATAPPTPAPTVLSASAAQPVAQGR